MNTPVLGSFELPWVLPSPVDCEIVWRRFPGHIYMDMAFNNSLPWAASDPP